MHLIDLNAAKESFSINETVVERFEKQVADRPDTIAVRFEGGSMTYKELDERANQVARKLRASGVGRDEIVVLLLDKTFDVVIGMLGVLKSGGAYLPLDVNYPQERINYILENSGTNSC